MARYEHGRYFSSRDERQPWRDFGIPRDRSHRRRWACRRASERSTGPSAARIAHCSASPSPSIMLELWICRPAEHSEYELKSGRLGTNRSHRSGSIGATCALTIRVPDGCSRWSQRHQTSEATTQEGQCVRAWNVRTSPRCDRWRRGHYVARRALAHQPHSRSRSCRPCTADSCSRRACLLDTSPSLLYRCSR